MDKVLGDGRKLLSPFVLFGVYESVCVVVMPEYQWCERIPANWEQRLRAP